MVSKHFMKNMNRLGFIGTLMLSFVSIFEQVGDNFLITIVCSLAITCVLCYVYFRTSDRSQNPELVFSGLVLVVGFSFGLYSVIIGYPFQDVDTDNPLVILITFILSSILGLILTIVYVGLAKQMYDQKEIEEMNTRIDNDRFQNQNKQKIEELRQLKGNKNL